MSSKVAHFLHITIMTVAYRAKQVWEFVKNRAKALENWAFSGSVWRWRIYLMFKLVYMLILGIVFAVGILVMAAAEAIYEWVRMFKQKPEGKG